MVCAGLFSGSLQGICLCQDISPKGRPLGQDVQTIPAVLCRSLTTCMRKGGIHSDSLGLTLRTRRMYRSSHLATVGYLCYGGSRSASRRWLNQNEPDNLLLRPPVYSCQDPQYSCLQHSYQVSSEAQQMARLLATGPCTHARADHPHSQRLCRRCFQKLGSSRCCPRRPPRHSDYAGDPSQSSH